MKATSRKLLATILSFVMVFGMIGVSSVSASSDYYSFTQNFEDFTKSDIGNKRTNNEMNFFYTNGTYDSATTAGYDIVEDEQNGNVLKLVTAPKETGGYLFYWLGEVLTNTVQVSYKFKIEGDISACSTYGFMGSSAGILMGVDRNSYYAGWGSGKTDLTRYIKPGDWNAVTYTLYLGSGSANTADVEINGNILNNVTLGGNGVSDTAAALEYLQLAPRFSIADDGEVITSYYDDITVKEITPAQVPLYSYSQDFSKLDKSSIGTGGGIAKDYFYTNGAYGSYTKASYDITQDPDTESGQGNVLKMYNVVGENAGTVWYALKQSVNGIVKIGFKVKVEKGEGMNSLNGTILRVQDQLALCISGDYFYVGWGSGKDSLGDRAKVGQWNTFALYMDLPNQKMLALDVNGQRLTGDAVNGSQYGFDAAKLSKIDYLAFRPSQFGLGGGDVTMYYDDLTIEEVAAPTFMSSSVADGATNVPWVNNIELMFDSPMDATKANNITLTQNGTAIGKKIEVNGNRVLLRHSPLSSNAECTLTIPATVTSVAGVGLSAAKTIKFTPSETYTAVLDFENTENRDISMQGNAGYGFSLYANHTFNVGGQGGPLKTNSKVEVIKEDGNKVLKFTADGAEGGGYLFAHLNQTHTGGIMDISFRFKIDTDPVGSYSMNFFEAHGAGLLTQQDSYFHTGWGEGKQSVGTLYNNFDWNTLRYIVDMTNKAAALILNEGTDKEVVYENINMGAQTPPAQLGYLRLGPVFAGLAAGKTLTAYYDDISVKRLASPTADLCFADVVVKGEIAAGNTVKVSGEVGNGTVAFKTPTVAVAIYGSDKQMKAVKICPVEKIVPKTFESFDTEFVIPGNAEVAEGDYIKVFGYKDGAKIVPFEAVVTK